MCCDNCLSQQQVAPSRPGDISRMSQSELAALFILDALRRMKWEVGREKLAQVLKGSKAEDILKFGYDKNRHYGRLAAFSRDDIKGFIDQLVAQGYLKVIGGRLPVLRLTPEGEAAIKARAAIPLLLPRQPRADVAVGRRTRRSIEPGDVAAFLSRLHPKPLSGPWQAGWALGFHSSFAGADWSRSTVGDLAFRLKYRRDSSALQPLVKGILALCDEHPELRGVDVLIPVPPSTARPSDPVKILAESLARALRKPLEVVLVKTRPTVPQKEMRTLAQKRANVAGAFAVQGDVRGKRLLLIDDLYDSGATLEEATRVLLQAGAARISVLTMTRTIHSNA